MYKCKATEQTMEAVTQIVSTQVLSSTLACNCIDTNNVFVGVKPCC